MARMERGPGRAVMVECDGTCGEVHALNWMALVGRYAMCKSCAPHARTWEEMEYEEERRDPAERARALQMRQELLSSDEWFTPSAKIVRHQRGLYRGSGE